MLLRPRRHLPVPRRVCLVRRLATATSSSAPGNAATNAGGGIPGDFVCHLRDVGFHLPSSNRTLFEHVSLGFLRGAKIGLLGANGCGKSTLLKILAGVQPEFDGERWVKQGLRIGYLPQEPQLDATKSVYANVMDGLEHVTKLLKRFEDVTMAMGDPDADMDALLNEQSELQDRIEQLDAWDLNFEVERAMTALRVPPRDADVTVLSGGERRRIALCRLLLEKPDMLLLDEPTNHLDAVSVAWLEAYLREYRGTVVSITHDRCFLDNVAGWVLEIDRGQTYAFEGNYTTWLEQRQQRFNLESKKDAVRAKQIANEVAWAQTHTGSKKATKARMKQLEALKKTKPSARMANGQIVIPNGPRLGKRVLEVRNLSKKLDDGRVLFSKLSFEVPPHAIVGVVGGNGTGKTTLFHILAGMASPDSGDVEVGQTVRLGYVAQNRDELKPRDTVYEAVSGHNDFVNIGDDVIPVRAFMASFNLRGTMQEKHIESLSGGERNRVHLARLLLGGNNVLLLDEPTNDLDVDTLRSLEVALTEFNGVSMVISHDRWFLDRICTHIIAFRGKGRVEFFEGNYTEYVKAHPNRSNEP